MTDLQRRMMVTLGALAAYVFGRDIPLIGLDPHVIWRGGLLLAFPGGFPHRLSLFALGITPFLSSWLLCEFACLASPSLARWRQAQPANQRRLAGIARGIGLAVAFVQAYGVALALESVAGLVVEPGWVFRFEATVTLATGALIVFWLSDVITARGLGDGFVVLLATPILVQLADWVPLAPELLRVGAIGLDALLFAGALMVGCIGVLAFASAPRAPRRSADALAGLAALDIWPIILAAFIAKFSVAALSALPGANSRAWLLVYALLFVAALFFFTFRRAGATPNEPPGRMSPRWTSAYAQAAVFLVLLLVRASANFPFALGLEDLAFVVVACAGVALSARSSLEAARL